MEHPDEEYGAWDDYGRWEKRLPVGHLCHPPQWSMWQQFGHGSIWMCKCGKRWQWQSNGMRRWFRADGTWWEFGDEPEPSPKLRNTMFLD